MGFGDFPWGTTPFGIDIPAQASVPGQVQPLQAMLYDIGTRGFPILPNGLISGVHPIDQKVALAMGIVNGQVKDDPTLGINFGALSRQNNGKKQIIAEQLIAQQVVLKKLVQTDDITILDVLTDTPTRGNDQVALDYINNRTGQRTVTSG